MDYSKAVALAKAFNAEVKLIFDKYNGLFKETYGDKHVAMYFMPCIPQFSVEKPSDGFEFDHEYKNGIGGKTKFFERTIDGVRICESVDINDE